MELPDPEIDPGEALFAVVGVDDVLTADRLRITADHRERAFGSARHVGLGRAIRREIRRFLVGELDRPHEVPAVEYRAALKVLTDPAGDRLIAQRLAAASDDDAEHAALVGAASRAVAHLAAIVPRRIRDTIFGDEQVTPPDSVVARFRWAYGVAERPMRVLDLLNAGTLIRDEARAMQAMFPTMYDAVGAIVVQELANLRGERPRAQLPIVKQRMLEALLLVTGSKTLADAVQALYAQPEQATEKPLTSAPFKGADQMSSPTDRIVNR